MKKNITLKFPVSQEKTIFGKKSGAVSTMVGEESVSAKSPEELESNVLGLISEIGRDKMIALARSKAGNLYICVERTGGRVDTYRPVDDSTGVVMLKNVATSFDADIKEEIQSWADHLEESGQ